jgi:hypothetical protein
VLLLAALCQHLLARQLLCCPQALLQVLLLHLQLLFEPARPAQQQLAPLLSLLLPDRPAL